MAKFYGQFADHVIKNQTLRRGFKKWPVAGAVAEFEHGADIGSRVTLSRVALVGPFALLLKKNRNKVYVAVQFADGEQLLIEGKAKHEKLARQFATKVTQAGEFYGTQESNEVLADAAFRPSSPPTPAPGVIPAGWYPAGDIQRYWDGTAWTEHTAPIAPEELDPDV